MATGAFNEEIHRQLATYLKQIFFGNYFLWMDYTIYLWRQNVPTSLSLSQTLSDSHWTVISSAKLNSVIKDVLYYNSWELACYISLERISLSSSKNIGDTSRVNIHCIIIEGIYWTYKLEYSNHSSFSCSKQKNWQTSALAKP